MMRACWRAVRAFCMALGLYSALPGFARWEDDCAGLLPVMLPIVGLCLGGLWGALALLAARFLPGMLAAVIIAAALPALTGFLHLDGFMDCADALLSARSREEKRRILKDPHAGAFSVIAVVLLLLMAVSAAHGAFVEKRAHAGALVLLPTIARAGASIALMGLPPLPESAYGRMNREAATGAKCAFCIALLVFACAAAFWVGAEAGAGAAVAALAFAAACAVGVRQLGGMNGDIAGFSICVAEVCGLIALACFY